MNKLIIKEWDYACDDGCCSDWGTAIIVNGVNITSYFGGANLAEDFTKIFEVLGIKIEIEEDKS